MNRLHNSRISTGLLCLPALAAAGIAQADEEHHEFGASLSGAQEVVLDESGLLVPGGTDTSAVGRADARFSEAFTEVQVNLTFSGLTGNFSAAHFHCGRAGQNGPVVFGMVNPGPLALAGETISGALTNADYTGEDCTELVGRPVNNIASLALAMRDGLIYANVHSDTFPAGEIRGQMLPDDDDDLDDDPDSDDDDPDDDDPYGIL